MSLHEFPELKEVFERLSAERESIHTSIKPHREKYNQLQEQIAPLEAAQREVGKELKKANPRLAEIDQQLSAIARSTGGLTMSEGIVEDKPKDEEKPEGEQNT